MRILTIFKILSLFIIILDISACGQKDKNNSEEGLIELPLCQFSSNSCQKDIQGVKFTIKITPEQVPSGKTLKLIINTDTPIESLTARIEGRDMFMGIIPIAINQTKTGQYQANVIIGSCASGYMVWRLFISADHQGKQINTSIDFLADNDKN